MTDAAASTPDDRRAAIAEFSAKIEDDLANGATLPDLAKDMGLQVQETAPLTADGNVFGKPGQSAPKELAPILQAAFSMEGERQAQLTETEPGKTFMIYDAGTITPAAPPPLAQIRDQVATDIQLSKGAKAAKAAAEKVKAQMEKGVSPQAALASLGLALPPVDQVDKARTEVQAQGQNASKPELLLFSMAKNSVKTLEIPGNRGWMVIALADVQRPDPKSIEPARVAAIAQPLAPAFGNELIEQLAAEAKRRVGVTINKELVEQLRQELTGTAPVVE